MEISKSWSFVCSVALIQLWVTVAFSRKIPPELQFGMKEETNLNDQEMATEELMDTNLPLSTKDEASIPYPRMLAPGYYSQECNAHKSCPRGKYCHLFLCFNCLRENAQCTNKGQCCRGLCSYGRCKGNAAPGGPGTFCNVQGDCSADRCCVREPAINPHMSICKPPLGENMVCGPINFFKNVYIGGQACGPCKKGLVCKQVGVFGVHEVCVSA